ncbi:GAF domain-containing protein [Demequina sp.]|uniref:GAF domain-containing protein n=1 Tax=Demequina sp. TaxID=2050685 RepID=UPI003A889123
MKRRYPILLAIASGVAGVVLQVLSSDVGWWYWLIAAILVAAIVGQAVVAGLSIRSAKEQRRERSVMVSDQFGPMAHALNKFAADSKPGRRYNLTSTLMSALSLAVGVTESDRVRATIFRVDRSSGVEAFVPWDGLTLGRGDAPQSRLERGTPEGDEVWDAAEGDDPRFYPDLEARVPSGWDASRKRAYRAFITVPIFSGKSLEGLLTINSPKAGDLSDEDVTVMQVIASLMGTAIGMSR